MPKYFVTKPMLITKATEVVEEMGVEKASLREVARRAGTSHGGPRHQFPTWNSLLAEVAKEAARDLDAELVMCWDASDDPRTNLKEAATAYLAFARERPALFELIHRHDLIEAQGANLRETTGLWIDEVRRNLADAGARHDDAAVLALWSAVHGMAVLAWRDAPSAVIPDGMDPAKTLGLVIDRAVGDSG